MRNSISTNGSIIEEVEFLACPLWPKNEPVLAENSIEVYDRMRNMLLTECSRSASFPTPKWWREAKCSNNTTPEIVRKYLNHKVLQFNSKKLFGESGFILQQISRAIKKENRVEIVLPVFCVISSWQKRHDITSVTFAEEASLLHLAKVATALERNIGVCLKFTIISDATFYARIFADPMDAAERYIRDLAGIVQKHDIGDVVQIVDMSNIIQARGSEYDNALGRNLEIFSKQPALGISEEEAARWKWSVGSTLNISDFGLSYDELRAMHCGGVFSSSAIEHEITNRVSKAFVHYRAMKQSLADLDWDRRAYPNALRGTIHHKTAPVIGVRVYPNYKRSCQLLPYHGIAMLDQLDGHWRMEIKHEIYLHDSTDIVRVKNGHDVSDFYVRRLSLESAIAA